MRTGLPLRLLGQDDSAFAILSRARRSLNASHRLDLWPAFYAEVTAGDYRAMLRVCRAWFVTDDPDGEIEARLVGDRAVPWRLPQRVPGRDERAP